MKKFIAGVVILNLLLLANTGFTKDYTQKFYDVPKEHWAFECIAELVDRGAINGYEDGSFKPNDTVARAEWAKIMVVTANRPLGSSSPSFNDMSGHWANPYVNVAKDYMTSYDNGTAFRPDVAALREDVTVAMVQLKGYDVDNVDFSYIAKFTDQKSISDSCKKYVAVAVEKGLISGFEDGTFRGQSTLSRAEAAALLWRAFQTGSDDKVVGSAGSSSGSNDNSSSSSVPAPEVTPPTESSAPSATPSPSDDETNEAIHVTVNGARVKFDQPPIEISGRTLVPIRAVMEHIGAEVRWNDTTQTMTVIYKNVGVALQTDNVNMVVRNLRTNAERTVELEIPPQIIGGSMLMPIRSVVVELGYTVSWNEKTQTVEIVTPENADL